jgi:hypothetical protein
MAYLDSWKSKLNKQGGNIANSLKSTAKQSVLASFENSPAYKLITVNGVSTGVRTEKGKLSNEMTLLFKPGTVVNIGSFCVIDTVNWVVMDSQKDEIFPKAKITLCNETLTIKTGETETITGYDSMGRPITDTTATYTSFPCVTSTKLFLGSYNDQDRAINLPSGKMLVSIKYDPLYKLDEKIEFDMYGQRFSIDEVDMTRTLGNVGIVSIIAKKIEKTA